MKSMGLIVGSRKWRWDSLATRRLLVNSAFLFPFIAKLTVGKGRLNGQANHCFFISSACPPLLQALLRVDKKTLSTLEASLSPTNMVTHYVKSTVSTVLQTIRRNCLNFHRRHWVPRRNIKNELVMLYEVRYHLVLLSLTTLFIALQYCNFTVTQ